MTKSCHRKPAAVHGVRPLSRRKGLNARIIHASLADGTQPAHLTALEQGAVLHFPALPFALSAGEKRLLDPALTCHGRKNISLDPGGATLHGVEPGTQTCVPMMALVARYARAAAGWVDTLFPRYRGHLQAASTSLRLHRVETRTTSWRTDDSRLHVDAFPSRPNQGRRILRVFLNINPNGEARVWRIGEPFEQVARRFLPRLPRQWPGSAWLMQQLHLTRSRRSRYDHLMLGLHDAMKADMDYQQTCSQQTVPFLPGAGWICFADQASHAAMAGQFMLEQTFFLDPGHMQTPACSPLAVLTRLAGRPLI